MLWLACCNAHTLNLECPLQSNDSDDHSILLCRIACGALDLPWQVTSFRQAGHGIWCLAGDGFFLLQNSLQEGLHTHTHTYTHTCTQTRFIDTVVYVALLNRLRAWWAKIDGVWWLELSHDWCSVWLTTRWSVRLLDWCLIRARIACDLPLGLDLP